MFDRMILECLAQTKSLTAFTSLVHRAGFDEIFNGPGPFTIFAPIDRAFDALPGRPTGDASVKDGLKHLEDVVTFHVLPGRLTSADFEVCAMHPGTYEGDRVQIRSENGRVHVENATVIEADIECRNGVVHVIDAVLWPELRAVANGLAS